MGNPTQTKAWQKLFEHFKTVSRLNMQDEFKQSPSRAESFTIKIKGIVFDYSKNLINPTTIELLIELIKEQGVLQARRNMFSGARINTTEDQSVLHTALRDFSSDKVIVEGVDILESVEKELQKMGKFVEEVRQGKWKGFTGKKIIDVVNLGIGGSNLGPKMAVAALQQFTDSKLNIHFVSNVDGANISEVLSELDPETTLFIVTSKKFSTKETLANARTARDWFISTAHQEKYIARHFVAVSKNIKLANEFGIGSDNIFAIWDFVGGRYSMWSAVGLPIALSVGFDHFIEMLEGAHEIDNHFLIAPPEKNIPMIMAAIDIWYINFYQTETKVILPYSYDLRLLSSYLQQLEMESNGKTVDKEGKKISYETAPIIWGTSGTEMQHSFFQLMLQGSRLIPADFIGFKESLSDLKAHHSQLMANFIAAQEALMNGYQEENPHKVVVGNRPSTTLLFDKLDAKTLGMLIALYEHKVFVQGVIWNINSFDQFGVELGKKLASQIEEEINNGQARNHDDSTSKLIDEIIK